jgi:bifunctional enzyme CysN/CysC
VPPDAQAGTDLLRVVTCGGPGDGTSTLVAGLRSRRQFVVVDVPGREQHTRELVTGASTADCAVVLVDARQGALTRTRRDAHILSLLGVRHIALAVNKLDLVGYAREPFEEIDAAFRAFARQLGVEDITCIPVSALHGDNVVARSRAMPWYEGPTVLEYLETVPVDVHVGRGAVVADAADPPRVGRQFQATIVWMGDDPMLRGREYLMEIGTTTVQATIAPLKYKVNVDSLERVASDTLELDEIGVCELELDRAIAFDIESRELGGFVLLDRITGVAVGAGSLDFELRRSQNVRWQAIDVDKAAHAGLKGQQPCLLWLTGLPGAGKSTIANLVERRLHSLGRHTYVLDGDNVRHGLNKDLGFTDADRVENIRRIAEVGRLMVDAGLIVIASFISPFRSERRMARDLLEPGEFVEIFVDTPLEIAEQRDPKQLYAKARRGEIKNFTGIDSPYEPPENPEIRIRTVDCTPEEAAEAVLQALRERGILGSAEV